MRFDTLLTGAESLSLAAEVAALRTPTRVLARGLHQEGSGRGWQFQMVVDEPNQAWIFDQQGEKHRDHYSDGVRHTDESAHELPFERSAPHPVRMVMPELMLQWGPPTSYLPILVQRIRDHWLLFTFEHEHDPAARITLVIDERTGIARRSYGSDDATIITEVRTMGPDEPLPPRPRFRKLTDRPAIEYLEE